MGLYEDCWEYYRKFKIKEVIYRLLFLKGKIIGELGKILKIKMIFYVGWICILRCLRWYGVGFFN